MRMTMQRSARVSGNRPMVAIALGHQEEKRTKRDAEEGQSAECGVRNEGPSPLVPLPSDGRGDGDSWVTRTTKAVFFRYPEFRMPRNSWFPFKKVSASSMSRVGWTSSITRKNAGELMLVETTGRWTSSLRTVSRVVLPQRFSGDSMPM